MANPERLQALPSNFVCLAYQTFQILPISSQKDASWQTDHNELIENESEVFHISNHANEIPKSDIEESALQQLMNWWHIREEKLKEEETQQKRLNKID